MWSCWREARGVANDGDASGSSTEDDVQFVGVVAGGLVNDGVLALKRYLTSSGRPAILNSG